MSWMNLEPIIQREVSQKENDKYCILMHIYGTLKNLFMGQQWRNRHREQTYGHGRGQERVRCMERVTWKLTLPYVKQIANGNCCMAQETQIGTLYQPRGLGWGERFQREGIYIYAYG